MNVHFIDTSVFTELLNVPHMNDHHDEVMKELRPKRIPINGWENDEIQLENHSYYG